eukprot:gene15200-16769_t
MKPISNILFAQVLGLLTEARRPSNPALPHIGTPYVIINRPMPEENADAKDGERKVVRIIVNNETGRGNIDTRPVNNSDNANSRDNDSLENGRGLEQGEEEQVAKQSSSSIPFESHQRGSTRVRFRGDIEENDRRGRCSNVGDHCSVAKVNSSPATARAKRGKFERKTLSEDLSHRNGGACFNNNSNINSRQQQHTPNNLQLPRTHYSMNTKLTDKI